MKQFRQCKVCGKPFEPVTPRHIICSDECRRLDKLQTSKEQQRKKALDNAEKRGTKKCVICGREFRPRNSKCVACSPMCQRERTLANARANNAKARAERIAQKEKEAQKAEEGVDMHCESIAEVNAKARDLHMTYGQYMACLAKQEAERERECKKKKTNAV